jgi:hypothetical protein
MRRSPHARRGGGPRPIAPREGADATRVIRCRCAREIVSAFALSRGANSMTKQAALGQLPVRWAGHGGWHAALEHNEMSAISHDFEPVLRPSVTAERSANTCFGSPATPVPLEGDVR